MEKRGLTGKAIVVPSQFLSGYLPVGFVLVLAMLSTLNSLADTCTSSPGRVVALDTLNSLADTWPWDKKKAGADWALNSLADTCLPIRLRGGRR